MSVPPSHLSSARVRAPRWAIALVGLSVALDLVHLAAPSLTHAAWAVGLPGLFAAGALGVWAEWAATERVRERGPVWRAGIAAAGLLLVLVVSGAGSALEDLSMGTTSELLLCFAAAWALSGGGSLLALVATGVASLAGWRLRSRLLLIAALGCAGAAGAGWVGGYAWVKQGQGSGVRAPDWSEQPSFGPVEFAMMRVGYGWALAWLAPLAFLPALTALRRVGDEAQEALEPLLTGFARVGAGDRAVRIERRGAPEFAWLAERFNEMVAQLSAAEAATQARLKEVLGLNEELKRQVAERSRALAREADGLAAQGQVLPQPGQMFDGRYQVVRELGRGGMGAVFEVRRERDGRAFALKVMSPGAGLDAARFFREAEIAARLSHARLVSVVDVGVAQKTLFLVMELVAGHSLEGLRPRFGTDLAFSLEVLRQVAEGVATLHEAGVVHRDLKPANVLVAAGEQVAVKIADFGISRQRDEVEPLGDTVQPATPGSSPRTHTGAMLGTPLYMAPEAARGAAQIGPPADVFALGLIAHELLTGGPAWSSPALFEALANRRLVPPQSVRLKWPQLSAALAHMLDTCLAESADARPTARALVDALNEQRGRTH